MAKLLSTKPTNLTEYPNSFERQGAFPLDANSMFWSLDAAKDYAANNGLAYVGQLITVITNEEPILYQIINTNGDLREFSGKNTWNTF